MSNDAPDIKILFNDNGLVIERHPDGELRLETPDNTTTEDVGIGVANIVSDNYNHDGDTTNFIDNELVRNIEITPRQLRLSDRKKIVYELSGGGNAWGYGSERYRHDFDKTYEDLWKKDAIRLKKAIQKLKTLGELMDYFYEEYIKDNYFYDDAMGHAYDYDSERDEEETYSKDADYIKEYAQNSYINKSESEVIDELYAELLEETEDSASKNGLDFNEDTFKEKIQEIVHETYKGINEQSLALFKKGGDIGEYEKAIKIGQDDINSKILSIKEMPKEKKISKKNYYLVGSEMYQNDANEMAEKIKADGYDAQVIDQQYRYLDKHPHWNKQKRTGLVSALYKSYDKLEKFNNGGGVGELPLIKKIKGYEIRYNEKEKTWKFPVSKGGEELTAFGYKSEAEEWIYDQLGSEFKTGGGVNEGKYYVIMDDGTSEWYNVKRVEDVPNVYFAIGNVGNEPQSKQGEVLVHRHNALRPLRNKDGSKVKPMPQYAGKQGSELELFETGGGVVSEISKSELESKVGRKLDGWNDDVVMYNGNKYKKCFLRPHYKIV